MKSSPMKYNNMNCIFTLLGFILLAYVDTNCGSSISINSKAFATITMPAKRRDTTESLAQLRALFDNKKILSTSLDLYIVPSEDAHHSEYIANCDERRAFISNFTGSSGTCLITKDKALLYTDGRYFIQAAEELDENWTLMKLGLTDTPSQSSWINKNLPENAVVGIDPFLISQDDWEQLSKSLRNSGKVLVPVTTNLVDIVWGNQRPPRPDKPVIELGLQFSGKSTESKINDMRLFLAENHCEYMVLTELDEIAWLLNLRGSDIPYNPVFFSYVIVTPNSVEVFIDSKKLSDSVKKNLEDQCKNVQFFPYENVLERLELHVSTSTGKFFFSKKCNHGLVRAVPEARRILMLTPIALAKAIKNPTEVDGMINSHIRDGAALCEYLGWLEKEMLSGAKLTEISAADKLEQFRSKQPNFMGLSFPSISSSGPNGAIIHYTPSLDSDRPLSLDEPYLIDSGGQYLDGTTDVTRTVHFGRPTAHQKDCFTRVLKGVIAVVTSSFPNKVVGNTLDSFARKALWDVGLDYIHGTGHGIGSFLNVHEGPHGISWRHLPDDPGLQANMFVSNEPGYYEEGQFGIRIENIIRVVPANGLPFNFANRGYLQFKDVTLVPIQQKMIAIDLLTDREINYINIYHAECRRVIGEYFKAHNMSETGFNWLMKETEPLQRTS